MLSCAVRQPFCVALRTEERASLASFLDYVALGGNYPHFRDYVASGDNYPHFQDYVALGGNYLYFRDYVTSGGNYPYECWSGQNQENFTKKPLRIQ
ncbi:MAG: hypothetical protein LDLANPLL_00944 [Turneriella sp.]|nr:hypothetical protein [Turneriella sp.]